MKLNLDSLVFVLIISALQLLWLPRQYLLPWQIWCAVTVVLTILLLLTWFYQWRRLRNILVYGICLCCSFDYMQYQALNLLQQAEQIEPQNQKAIIRIDEIQHQQSYQTLVTTTQNDNPQRVYVQWKAEDQPKIGEIWQVEWRLRPLSARLNQGGFDRQQWCFSKGIVATANVKSAVKIGDDFSWREQRLLSAFNATQGLKQQGLLLALGFGERAWLDSDTWRIYQQTNTAHLIAISGLHIGLAMLLGFGLARGLQFLFPTARITPLFPILSGLILALVYAQLAGFAIPTFRAVMALFIVYGVHLRRYYCTAWQLLIRVVAVLLLCDPLMILSSSFWLSVSAVSCLILWYQVFPLSLFLWNGKKIPQKARWILGLFHLQFGLFWLFTPIQLAIFGGFSPNGFWANLFAVPLYSFVLVPLTLFATLSNGALFSWQIADFLALWITQILRFFDNSWITLSQKTILIITALLVFIFIIALNRLYRQPKLPPKDKGQPLISRKQPRLRLNPERQLSPIIRNRISLLGILVICGISGRLGIQGIYSPNWQIETLDVGQGLATLIVKNGRGALYDTGASWGRDGGSMAKTEILPYLQRQGIELDWVILSHDDNDHSGGATQILAEYPEATLLSASYKNYYPKNLEKNDRAFCVQGEHWQWQGLDFRVLSPEKIVERADNADSCVILVSDGSYNLLLTGDADTGVEHKILTQLPRIDVLQVGHHGSKTSTGSRFVQQIQPKIALISASRWNPWHFPNKDVVTRLKQAQSAVWNTAISGQISVNIYDERLDIRHARSDFSPWYARFIGAKEQ